MKVKVFAPTRIDLAGGTLDIYPLYLFAGGGVVLNVAIDLFAQVDIEVREDSRITVEAADLGLSLEAEELNEFVSKAENTPLDLVARVLEFYRPRQGLNILISSKVPAGSGLGGSSALLISLSTGLVQLENIPSSKKQIIDFGSDIEAQSLRVPTGKQDYFPAAYGGFNALWFELPGIRREELVFSKEFRQELQSQIVLGYSGASRFSGLNNWNVVKQYIDNEQSVVKKLAKIKQTAFSMYQCLKEENLEGFSDCLVQEWSNRKELATGVTSVAIENIFAAAHQAGAQASKICGAGGGGCFITLAREGCQEKVKQAIVDNGGEIMDYCFSDKGVRVVE